MPAADEQLPETDLQLLALPASIPWANCESRPVACRLSTALGGPTTFLRATRLMTWDLLEVEKTFSHAVFNVVFHNRDDHAKNFAYRLGTDLRSDLQLGGRAANTKSTSREKGAASPEPTYSLWPTWEKRSLDHRPHPRCWQVISASGRTGIRSGAIQLRKSLRRSRAAAVQLHIAQSPAFVSRRHQPAASLTAFALALTVRMRCARSVICCGWNNL